jgi:hypothetical protein
LTKLWADTEGQSYVSGNSIFRNPTTARIFKVPGMARHQVQKGQGSAMEAFYCFGSIAKRPLNGEPNRGVSFRESHAAPLSAL